MNQRLTRFLALVILFAIAASLGGVSNSSAQGDEFDWRRYEGTTIRVLWPNTAWTDFILEQLPTFEELTGIKVNMETFVEDQLRQKLTVELIAGSDDIDIFGSMTIQEGFKYHKAGWYTTLDDLINDPALTNADFDFEDFTEGAISLATVNGDLIGIPTYSDVQIMIYRPSILEAAGLEVPSTFEETEAVAAALNDPANDFYGWINRGKGAAATSVFSSVLYGMGGAWTVDGAATMNTPEAIAAFEWWGKMLRDYGPPGAVNNSWPENVQLFTTGHGALWTESGQAAATILDPEQSQVVDDVGFAVVPGGKPYAYGWVMSIPPNAPHREAAWYFIQWATNKENSLQAKLLGIPAPRTSSWEDPAFTENDPNPGLTAAMLESLAVAMPYMNPHIVNVQPWRDTVGQVIVDAIEGKDVEASANAAQEQLEELLKQEQ